MWSLGCVLAELVILRPVLEGEDTGDQLASIVDILGVPSDEDLENMRVEDNMLAQAVRASQVRFHRRNDYVRNAVADNPCCHECNLQTLLFPLNETTVFHRKMTLNVTRKFLHFVELKI